MKKLRLLARDGSVALCGIAVRSLMVESRRKGASQ
jgi:hypothetical protein